MDDVVNAFLCGGAQSLELYSVYNVCSAEPVSVRSAAEMSPESWARRSRSFILVHCPTDPTRRCRYCRA